MKQRFISLMLCFLFVLSMPADAFAINNDDSIDIQYSTEPTERALEHADRLRRDVPRSAWFTKPDGTTIPVNPDETYGDNNGLMRSPPDYFNITWTRRPYISNSYSEDDYKFFVAGVSLRNKSENPIPLTYIQKNSVQLEWEFQGDAEVEADFGLEVLADISAHFSASFATNLTSYADTTVEFEMEVPVGKVGHIDKYYGGAYSGGLAIWDGYNPFTDTEYGTYTEEIGAWAIRENEINYDVYVTAN